MKILIAVLDQGWIRPELAAKLALWKSDTRAEVDVRSFNERPSENNRNRTVQVMLDGGYDYLISIDHDTVPLNNIIDLALLGLDVVGCAYPSWNAIDPYPIYILGMDKAEGGYTEHKLKDGLQEVDAVGSGALVMSRKVLEAVKEPFLRKWENGFAITGLDFFFCEKAKAAGFKVYCHYGYPAEHFKEIGLLAVLQFKHHG